MSPFLAFGERDINPQPFWREHIFSNQKTKDKAFKTCCASSSHHNYFFVFEFNSNRKNVFSIFSFGKHLNALLGSQVWWWCVHVIFKVQVPFIVGEIKVSWKKACVEGFEGCGKQSQNNSKKPLYLIWCIKVHVERILVFTMTSSPRSLDSKSDLEPLTLLLTSAWHCVTEMTREELAILKTRSNLTWPWN